MAGCISCFILPLLLFLFHRFLQPLILKFWNPWPAVKDENNVEGRNGTAACPFSCNKSNDKEQENDLQHPAESERLKAD